MTYVKASVRRPAGNPGNGIQPKDQLVIYDVDDILSFPQRNDAGVVIEDDIVMKAGRYAIGIYLTPGTAEISSNSAGETDAEGYTPSVKFNHPGNEQEIREFKTNWLSKKCIVVLRYCSGKPADLIGTPCNPCKLSVSYTGSNESNTNELTFTQISKGDDIAIYRGTDTLEEPVAVVEAGATDIDYQTDGQYQLSAGAAKIAGMLKEKAASNSDVLEQINAVYPIDSSMNPTDIAIYELDEGDGSISLLKTYQGLPSDDNFLNNMLEEANETFVELLEIQQTL